MNYRLLALALPIVLGAGIWGANYRLDHPPLSQNDKKFRGSVTGADSVVASQWACQGACSANTLLKFKPLDAAQTRQLIEQFRFRDPAPDAVLTNWGNGGTTLDLSFRRAGKELARYTLTQNPAQSELTDASKSLHFSTGAGWKPFYFGLPCQLHPRFEKSLRRTLDEVWPNHVPPQKFP